MCSRVQGCIHSFIHTSTRAHDIQKNSNIQVKFYIPLFAGRTEDGVWEGTVLQNQLGLSDDRTRALPVARAVGQVVVPSNCHAISPRGRWTLPAAKRSRKPALPVRLPWLFFDYSAHVCFQCAEYFWMHFVMKMVL